MDTFSNKINIRFGKRLGCAIILLNKRYKRFKKFEKGIGDLYGGKTSICGERKCSLFFGYECGIWMERWICKSSEAEKYSGNSCRVYENCSGEKVYRLHVSSRPERYFSVEGHIPIY